MADERREAGLAAATVQGDSSVFVCVTEPAHYAFASQNLAGDTYLLKSRLSNKMADYKNRLPLTLRCCSGFLGFHFSINLFRIF